MAHSRKAVIPWRWRDMQILRPLTLLVLLLFFIQATTSAAQTSLTIDEGLHITSGYSILKTGDYRLIEEHPPLIKTWMALPLLPLRSLPDLTALSPWEAAAEATTESLPLLQLTQQLFYPLQPFDLWAYPPRVMVALLGVLLGAVVWRWTADLGGAGWGLLGLLLFTFDPNILAHAAVAGTDLGAAFYATLALFCLTRYLRRPSQARLLLAGVTLGLAQGAKLSALLLVPVALGALLLARIRPRQLLLYCVGAGVTLWALYGFQIGPVPGLPAPAPAASHAIPWMRLRQHSADGHAAFLMGANRSHGWWIYFPVAFALKTPLPTLALLLAALTGAIGAVIHNVRSNASLRLSLPSAVLLSFPLLYFAASLFSPLNIGYRHLLPMLPPLYIGISTGLTSLHPVKTIPLPPRLQRHAAHLTLGAVLFWLAVPTVRIAPHHLAFFNELAGGPEGGWRYLADSNTDWGQGYKDLARFQEEHNLGPVRLSAFIFYDPAAYGVDYSALPPLRGDTPAVFPSRLNPPPGDYVISATTINGIPLADPEMYDWFRKRPPDAQIAYALFYYHVPDPPVEPGWLAQCTSPVAPLTPDVTAEGLGRSDLRMVYFDCTQTWLYPEGGKTGGWYAHFLDAEMEMPLVEHYLSAGRLAYEQRSPRETPPFALYDWPADSSFVLPEDARRQSVLAWDDSILPDRQLSSDDYTHPPLPLEGPLTFQGARLAAPDTDETLVLWTYWSVTESTARPFSIMAHLLSSKGALLTVGDGLGVDATALRPGDLIAQRHTLETHPHSTTGTWLQIGVYWLDTLERWPILAANGKRPTQLLLNPDLER